MTLPHVWRIPKLNGKSLLKLEVTAGSRVLFVGANGSGKSALSHWIYRMTPGDCPIIRILAHRQIWMSSPGPDISPSNHAKYVEFIKRFDLQPESRYQDDHSTQRSASILFQLLSRVHQENSLVADMARSGAPLDPAPSILDVIGDAIAPITHGIRFSTNAKMEFEAHRGGSSYPISRMSDGEKSAFLLGAEIMLAAPGSIVILDEPERHLHRAASAQVIEDLTAERSDCAFLVFTHDLTLSERLATHDATIISVGGVEWRDDVDPAGWIVEEIESFSEVPEYAKIAILGGRSRVIFIEGDSQSSLDRPLYAALFPQWHFVPTGSCHEVISCTQGLRRSQGLHWITAVGIIDGDARTAAERDRLFDQGIITLPVEEVECFYYLPRVIAAVASTQARTLGNDTETLTTAAVNAALDSLTPEKTKRHLASTNTLKVLERTVLDALPTGAQIQAQQEIQIQAKNDFPEQLATFTRLLEQRNLEQLVRAYSIRDSGLRAGVSRALGFDTFRNYEIAARVLISTDKELREHLRSMIVPPHAHNLVEINSGCDY